MTFSDDEKKLLKFLIQKEIKDVSDEGDTIIEHEFPSFLKAEAKYEEFLKNLLSKL